MKIHLEFRNFSSSAFPSLPARVCHKTSWVALVWSAITSGKKNAFYWLPHPWHSFAEATSRAFSIYANLKGCRGHIARSKVYDHLDPTEKGAASYSLGMALAKLVAEDFFKTPWLFHVHGANQVLTFLPGNSRPDLMGQNSAGDWLVFEAKGRSNGVDLSALSKAKTQAGMISTINGIAPNCSAGLVAHFSPWLSAVVEDPEPFPDAIAVEVNVNTALRAYYSLQHSIEAYGEEIRISDIPYVVRRDPESGISIGLPRSLLKDQLLSDIKFMRTERRHDSAIPDRELGPRSRIFSDGFYVSLDERWSDKNMEKEIHDRAG